jgi:outer membrane immunogenic protein
MMRTLSLAIAALVLAAPALEAQQRFDRAYAGGVLGYTSGDSDASFRLTGPGTRSTRSVDASGAEFGLYGGARLPVQGFLVGVELGGLWSDASENRAGVFGPGTWRASVSKDSEFYLSFNAGAEVQPGVLLYGLAGLQIADYELSMRDEVTGATSRNSSNLTGWHLGLGAEAFVTENVSVRGEYRYQSFDSLRVRNNVLDARIEPTENVFRLGVSYYF